MKQSSGMDRQTDSGKAEENQALLDRFPRTLKIWTGSPKFKRKQVENLFEPYGRVNFYTLGRGSLFVRLETRSESEAALKDLNNVVFEGKRVGIVEAPEKIIWSKKNIKCKSYEIWFADGALSTIGRWIEDRWQSSKYVIITDSNVGPLYARMVAKSFSRNQVHVFTIKVAGEISKCREQKAEIEDWMVEKGCDRQTVVVALGGGVVGDLAGFVAATYMRGIRFLQIPTSTMAMFDSSVGGKTAVDTPKGKNLVGAFYRPEAVIIDTQTLRTLPKRQFLNGIAEAIKHGIIYNSELFDFMEANVAEIKNLDSKVLMNLVWQSIKVKAEVVEIDERESGLRKILNFGHTIGHAIEALMDPTLIHGECVSIGMVYEALIARHLGHIDNSTIRRLRNILKAYELPCEMPKFLEVSALLAKANADKKNKDGVKHVVILGGIGKTIEKHTLGISDKVFKIILCPSVSFLSGKQAKAKIEVPGSKSISNRILLIAALGEGSVRLKGLLHSEDTQVMIDSLRKLGVQFDWENNGKILVVTGCGGKFQVPKSDLFLGNAGTASRFLASACNLVKGGETQTICLKGVKRMHERPIGDLVEALQANGCSIEYLGENKALPLQITCGSGFPGGEITMNASVSSQYVSSILISAPYAEKEVTLNLVEGKVSPKYIEITIACMKAFGVEVREVGPQTYVIPSQRYKNPKEYEIEGDASSATYPLALAAVTGGEVSVNIGDKSMQGDAEFADLLEKMGCATKRNASTTTVNGERRKLVGAEVDMGDMTDAFMTACAVAALSEGETRITNIANQRVKECDRIAAMVRELGKIGIKAWELETGIAIIGNPALRIPEPVYINCYHDHRIAMSFGVLGSRFDNIIVSNKQCVDKTYPEFWDTMAQYGLSLNPDCHQLVKRRHRNKLKQVFLIGMRGAGKTTLGRDLSSSMGGEFIDVDEEITAITKKEAGMTISEFVQKKGWDAFRELEAKVTLSLANKTNFVVVACGGGVVETEEMRRLLTELPAVIFIDKHIDDIQEFLKDEKRPAYGESIRDVYKRRKKWYRQCAKFEFPIAKGEADFGKVAQVFCRRMKNALDVRRKKNYARLGVDEQSFFVSLTQPDISRHMKDIAEICRGVDVVEARIDLLKSQTKEYISEQIAYLRMATNLPILYTVRTTGHGGKFEGTVGEYMDLLGHGARLGCEFLDIEIDKPASELSDFILRRGNSKIVASIHTPGSNGGSEIEIMRMMYKAAQLGQVQVIKVVTEARSVEDGHMLLRAVKRANIPQFTGVVALAMGAAGRLTRLMGKCLTPVTHPLLPTRAAPGQLDAKDIQQMRNHLGMNLTKKFYIFGSPVGKSPSPTLYNTVFRNLYLPHTYEAFDTKDAEEAKKIINEPDFKGCSVTIPLKEDLMSVCKDLSKHAKKIGALNFIVRRKDGTLYGDNTDWIAIFLLVKSYGHIGRKLKCLILGAGGAAKAATYAMTQLFKLSNVFVYNRTFGKAKAIAAQFKVRALESLDGVEVPFDVVISMIPGSAKVTVPKQVISSNSIVFDGSYIPHKTELLKQAEECGCTKIIHGIDMLIAQGYPQAEMFTDRPRVAYEDDVDREVRSFYKTVTGTAV